MNLPSLQGMTGDTWVILCVCAVVLVASLIWLHKLISNRPRRKPHIKELDWRYMKDREGDRYKGDGGV